jgi:iron complex transport system substrate-binding protein
MNWFKYNFTALFVVNLFFVFFGIEAHAGEAKIPKSVVSLAPSVTETLFALGLGDRLVGVTNYCDYPPEALKVPKIGDFISPNIEAIMAKRPDLVIGVSGATDLQKTKELERLGLKVVLVSAANLNEIMNSMKSIAGLLGNEAAGKRLVMKINAQVSEVKKRVEPASRRPVLLLVGIRPLIAVGGKNFIDELITLAGGTNIAGNAGQPWLNLPDEYVVAKAPQVIIEAGMGSEREASSKRWEDLKSIPAVRQGRIYSYPSDKILRPGPRFGEALEELARLIHPECFNSANNQRNGESRCESPRP